MVPAVTVKNVSIIREQSLIKSCHQRRNAIMKDGPEIIYYSEMAYIKPMLP